MILKNKSQTRKSIWFVVKVKPVLSRVTRFLKALWLYIAGVIAVLAIYYLLTAVEQGIDVVILSGEQMWPGILTVVCVFLWAFLVWYSCRMLSYIRQNRDDEMFVLGEPSSARLYKKYCIPATFHRHIPRLLAYNCFVSVQVAIFNLPRFENFQIIQDPAWRWFEMFLIICLHNTFYFLLTDVFEGHKSAVYLKRLKLITSITIILYSGFLMYHIVIFSTGDLMTSPLRHRFWLLIIALLIFILQVASVFFFVSRRRMIDKAVLQNPEAHKSRFMQLIGVNPRFNAAEIPAFIVFHGVVAIVALFYFLSVFTFSFSRTIGPMAFSLLALGVLTGLANFITMGSIRISFNLFILVYVLAFIFGQFREPYEVRLTKSEENEMIFSKRLDTQEYLKKWFTRTTNIIQRDSSRKFPVYIVLSNGGASRAGKWSSSVLSHIQDSTYNPAEPDNSFKDHILCIAGASGGTVGNCVFYSLMKAAQDGKIEKNHFEQHSSDFFKTDFLTYTLARFLGPDMFRHISPVQILPDRAAALEEVIAGGSKDQVLNAYFNTNVSDVFDNSGSLPILFINATQVDNGMPGVIGSAKLPTTSQRTDILSLVDSMSKKKEGNLLLTTGAVLSSRFPYVSPAGKIYDRYYVDGGYFDNSGAGTVLEFIQEMEQFFKNPDNDSITQYRHRYTFHIVHITNSEQVPRPTKNIHPLINDLLTPVLTLAGMQGSSTNIGNGILRNAFKPFNSDSTTALITYSLYNSDWPKTESEKGKYEEGYPMSWVISHYQLDRIEKALKEANNKNFDKFKF
jgi:hypothetical protein